MDAINSRCGPLSGCVFKLLMCAALAASLPAAAQDLSGITAVGPRVVTAEDRSLVTMPAYPTPPIASTATLSGTTRHAEAPMTIEIFDTESHRVHVVSMAGETWKAAVPLDGSGVWLAFDPARRSFAELLPSIRVELGTGVELDAVAKAVNAAGIEVFDTLGFAIVTLPAHLHPADAAERVEALSGQPDTALRLRRPRIQWR